MNTTHCHGCGNWYSSFAVHFSLVPRHCGCCYPPPEFFRPSSFTTQCVKIGLKTSNSVGAARDYRFAVAAYAARRIINSVVLGLAVMAPLVWFVVGGKPRPSNIGNGLNAGGRYVSGYFVDICCAHIARSTTSRNCVVVWCCICYRRRLRHGRTIFVGRQIGPPSLDTGNQPR